MNINSSGTYVIEEDNYELIIDYKYHYSTGTYEEAPIEDMEIESVKLNGMDITDFFWDYIGDGIYNQVIEYARDNCNK